MNKRAVGTKYEEKAALYLKDHGYEIIQKNYRCKIGEIDIVASQGPYLVFVEVKYRMDAHSGSALDAVGYGKQQKILKTANMTFWYLQLLLRSELMCQMQRLWLLKMPSVSACRNFIS